MTGRRQQKGFTLVELAIVITIIGLLIGGVLKGQQRRQNARGTATVAKIKAIGVATLMFQDSYGFKPGDFDGTGKIPGCGATMCVSTTATSAATNDGKIGATNWGLVTPQAAPTITAGAETYLFWYYLAATNMLSGMRNPTAA